MDIHPFTCGASTVGKKSVALAKKVKEGAELSSRVITILDWAMLVIGAYEMASDFSRLGPPGGGMALAVASGGHIKVLPLGIAIDWYALLEKLVFIGAMSSYGLPYVLMSQSTRTFQGVWRIQSAIAGAIWFQDNSC